MGWMLPWNAPSYYSIKLGNTKKSVAIELSIGIIKGKKGKGQALNMHFCYISSPHQEYSAASKNST
jgi:hypothetical protein